MSSSTASSSPGPTAASITTAGHTGTTTAADSDAYWDWSEDEDEDEAEQERERPEPACESHQGSDSHPATKSKCRAAKDIGNKDKAVKTRKTLTSHSTLPGGRACSKPKKKGGNRRASSAKVDTLIRPEWEAKWAKIAEEDAKAAADAAAAVEAERAALRKRILDSKRRTPSPGPQISSSDWQSKARNKPIYHDFGW
ncbi:uncharacterized protein EHS24_007323 [Apiotrichum porosum]|uniref:Uncharacterized protein n=1 Tax=Apiotrichum porosum TaxID=105984 RepID=A0A427XTT9_9TREE|nr:uncharacterized protein EHS24_007323 [Apiotrichum porosum]RSH82356.1 hypothetical protein EHS24_007323 [Apiotrichum porosum]